MPFPVSVFLLSSCGRMMVRIAVVCAGICRMPVCRGLRFTVRDLRRAAYPALHTAISFRKPAEFCGISLTSRGKTVTIKSSLKSLTFYRGVAQLVARLLWEQDVGSSSLFTSTRLSLDAIRAPGSNAFCSATGPRRGLHSVGKAAQVRLSLDAIRTPGSVFFALTNTASGTAADATAASHVGAGFLLSARFCAGGGLPFEGKNQ